jgi:hypothetical protein
MSTHKLILESIDRCKSGKVLFPSDFRGLGSDNAIKMSLSRIATEGGLERISNGLYMKPGKIKKIQIDPQALAGIIAIKEQVRIRPAGEFAKYKLGLILQEPQELTYVTDGQPRMVTLTDRTITFKPTTPKKISMSGKISALVIQVMEDTGYEAMSTELDEQLTKLLKTEEKKSLAEDLKKAPAWVYQYIRKRNIIQ